MQAQLLQEHLDGAVGLMAGAAAGRLEVGPQAVAGGVQRQQPHGADQQALAMGERVVGHDLEHDPRYCY
ncbi:hypothetical protein [Phenylobacterium sp.]|uniref:hypothetical protein n=1 Tax=Phenylobacterium sp. TaxID=1871053 RepID=UPI0025EE5195|nr:hypothetical protein [Phenylobacterium sp.]